MKTLVKISITLLILAATSLSAIANPDNIEAFKFEMIRRAVVFYATDPMLNPGAQSLGCAEQNTIPDLKNCSASMQGVGEKIDDYNAVVVKSAKDLESLKNKIINEVNRDNGREELVDWASFKSGLDSLYKSYQQEIAPGQENHSARAVSDSPTLSEMSTEKPIGEYESKSNFIGIPSIWTLVALVLSGIAIYLALKKKKPVGRRKEANFSEIGNPHVDEELRRDIDQLQREIYILKKDLSSFKANQAIASEKQREDAIPVEAVLKPIPQPSAVLKYAKTADGNSFDLATLSDSPSDKSIYELLIKSNTTATFKVTANREAQLFALEDPNTHLRGACIYQGSPARESRITTLKPGTLEFRNNLFHIVTPAELEFT